MCLSGALRGFCFSVISLWFLWGCNSSTGVAEGDDFTFSIIDVGQGLSQIAFQQNRSVVFDMGPARNYDNWLEEYKRIGKPHIEAIVISHTHEDHWGGLRHLDSSINWSGTLIISPHEDSSFLREKSTYWRDEIQFELCVWDDTLYFFDEVIIRCLWPPENINEMVPIVDRFKNFYSLVFSLEHHRNSVLITSDIDTLSQQNIYEKYGYQLRSDIVVAPHHGSAGSADHIFFGYVLPSVTVISCSENNTYGHPSRRMLQEIMNTGSETLLTYIDGTVVFRSNGYYWSRLR
ncbi:MBL fold metallo-hydrolase [Chitinispirillales bacterium ANBcel5]|uniref:ComEC/Rec2 family competence protein n=1 Tax=Cellulosispirillum alkaliphilum TaxID=3039283 RepID=UPI002A4F3A5A|nr:MBL fold metallo-hydrolase [Chitinispirillales bacterium ANBcel5]